MNSTEPLVANIDRPMDYEVFTRVLLNAERSLQLLEMVKQSYFDNKRYTGQQIKTLVADIQVNHLSMLESITKKIATQSELPDIDLLLGDDLLDVNTHITYGLINGAIEAGKLLEVLSKAIMFTAIPIDYLEIKKKLIAQNDHYHNLKDTLIKLLGA
jgi:hypothetical protein